MLLSPLELLMPAVMLILIFLPLIKVIRGKTSLRSAKIRLASHICMFFGIAIGFVIFSMYKVQAAEAVDTASQMNGSIAQGLGFLAAAVRNRPLFTGCRHCRRLCCSGSHRRLL